MARVDRGALQVRDAGVQAVRLAACVLLWTATSLAVLVDLQPHRDLNVVLQRPTHVMDDSSIQVAPQLI